jgi:hypothetical protein
LPGYTVTSPPPISNTRVEAEAAELTALMAKQPSEAGRLAVDLSGLRARIAELEGEWETATAALEEAR